jgi:hypothetical protein
MVRKLYQTSASHRRMIVPLDRDDKALADRVQQALGEHLLMRIKKFLISCQKICSLRRDNKSKRRLLFQLAVANLER